LTGKTEIFGEKPTPLPLVHHE